MSDREEEPLTPNSLVSLRVEGSIPPDVVALLMRKGCTMEEIGLAFGVTRERARQVALKAGVTGRDIRAARARSRWARHLREPALSIAEFMAQRGFTIDVPTRSYNMNNFLADGLFMAVRRSSVAFRASKQGTAQYFRIRITTPADFVVLLTPQGRYVLPAELCDCHMLYIREGDDRPYDVYREAWPEPKGVTTDAPA